jgi:hypothetical protein
MKRKYVLFPVIFVASLLIGIQTFAVVNANPVGMYGQKPKYAIVSIDSPIYSSQVSFTVKTNYYWATDNNLTDTHCFIIIDANTYEVHDLAIVNNITISNDFAYDPYIQYTLKGTTELSNLRLANGTHNLEVDYGYYHAAFVNRMYNTEFVSLGSATSQIILTQNITQKPTFPSPALVPNSLVPTPIPTQSMPTINTGPTLPIELNPPVIYIVLAIVIVILAVASVSLVYFKKHGGRIK